MRRAGLTNVELMMKVWSGEEDQGEEGAQGAGRGLKGKKTFASIGMRYLSEDAVKSRELAWMDGFSGYF